MASYPRALAGAATAAVLVAGLSAAMLLLRDHLSVAFDGLVLVVPVVVGVVVGGLAAGIAAAAVGFVVYEVVLIPQYGTSAVGAAQSWVALVVYVVVLVLVAKVVADQRHAWAEAAHREQETRRLFDLSEALIAETPDLAQRVVDTVQQTFGSGWVVLVLPNDDALHVAASAGLAAPVAQLDAVLGTPGTPVHLLEHPSLSLPDDPAVVALVADGHPVGLLAISPAPAHHHDRRLLATFANQVALSIARANLRELAVRSERLEAAEETRQILLRAVSHDLRTPLATIKASLSGLRDPGSGLAEPARQELLGLAEEQADRLDRLVANLLDVTRVEAGTLLVRRQPVAVDDVIDEALAILGRPPVTVALADDVDLVDADHLLICHVLVNLVDNAFRYAPGDIVVSAARHAGRVELAVADRGPGTAAVQLRSTASLVGRSAGGTLAPSAHLAGDGHSGLGLAIADAFVGAHGSRLSLDDNPGGGARLSFTLPVGRADAEDLDSTELAGSAVAAGAR
ncbi:MAG: ATP-binding protein [Actinomycetota bacterium]|jgi:two-component system sensor histidine kinase KdpD|nr:ATP-binding protein [Actinomycetota bacterium]